MTPLIWQVNHNEVPNLLRELDARHGYKPDNRVWQEEHMSRRAVVTFACLAFVVVVALAALLATNQWLGFAAGLFLGATIGAIGMGLLIASKR